MKTPLVPTILIALCAFAATADASKRKLERTDRSESLDNSNGALYSTPSNAFFQLDANLYTTATVGEATLKQKKRDLSAGGPDASNTAMTSEPLLSEDVLEPGALGDEPQLWDEMDDRNLYWRQVRRDQSWQFGQGQTRLAKRTAVKLQSHTATVDNSTRFTASAFNYGSEPIRGVNLGGWLLTEPWIKPSLYKAANQANGLVVDEWTLCQYQSRRAAQTQLAHHWATWITVDDFWHMKAAGINHVRIPVGFWALDVSGGEPYIQGSLYWLHRAVSWAAQTGIKVMIDLHGAPGSQNGFDNSGRRGAVLWHTNLHNVRRTVNVVAALASEFSKKQYHNIVTAINPLNEPAGWYSDELLTTAKEYFVTAYDRVRYPRKSKSPSALLYAFSDAFQPLSTWSDFLSSEDDYHYVALDTHIYTVFSDAEIQYTEEERIAAFCSMGDRLEQSDSSIWTFVGEWSPAPTECAGKMQWVSYPGESEPPPIGSGSRWDGTISADAPHYGSCEGMTGSALTFSTEYKQSLRRFWEAQATTYEKASGWIMWCWKNENEDWSYSAGLEHGWIPQDPEERLYPNICD